MSAPSDKGPPAPVEAAPRPSSGFTRTDLLRRLGWVQGALSACVWCHTGTVWTDEQGRPLHAHCRDGLERSSAWRGGPS